MQTKKWYQSKIVLLGLVLGFVGASDLSFHWLSGNVTAEQFAAVETQYPVLKDGIKQAIESKNIFGVVTTLGGFAAAIFRVWFTNTSLTA